jgi:ketosteroid isomerase-like protein
MEAENKHAVQAGFEASRNGTGSVFDLLAPGATWTIVSDSSASKTFASHQEILDSIVRPFNAWLARRKPAVHGLDAIDDLVLVIFDVQGVNCNGASDRDSCSWCMQMRDGQIVGGISFVLHAE